jgi:hypothetical protein
MIYAGLLVISISAGWSRADTPPSPRHLAGAVDLVRHLEVRHTGYEHGKGHIQWTGTRESHTDCSGFLDHLLMHSYGYTQESFKKWLGSRRPTAARYHDGIVAQNGFEEVKRVADIRPGDILTVKYNSRRDNTGHVMLVAAVPVRIKAHKPFMSGTEQWEVAVIDSSMSGHGPSDTRHAKGKDGKDHPGLGRGVLRIYTDHQGRVAGFTWSTLGVSKIKDPADEHLVIGRLTLAASKN